MRGRAVTAQLITAAEGSTLDETVGGEQLTHVDLGGTEAQLPDRVFTLALVDWTEDIDSAGRVCVASYELEVFYAAHEGLRDRMHDDIERVNGALRGLHSGDLLNVSTSPWSVGSHPNYEGVITAICEVSARYNLDDGV